MFLKRLLLSYRLSYSGLSRDSWLLALVVFINRCGSIVLFFLSLYLTRKMNFSVSQAGSFISLYGIGSLVGSLAGGILSDRIGPFNVQILSLVTAGFGFIIFSNLQDPVVIGIVLFVLAICAESFRPANITAVAQVSPPDARPRGFALNRLAVNLGITIGPVVGGILAHVNYKIIFWVDGLTCLMAAGFMLVFFRHFLWKKSRFSGSPGKEPGVALFTDKIFLAVILLVFLIGLVFVQLFNT